MANVNISTEGLQFVRICLQNYWGPLCFFGVFIAVLFWFAAKPRKDTNAVLGYTLLLFCTIYNPFIVKYIYVKLNSEKIYYRFFWLLPVSIVLAYACVRLVAGCTTKAKKLVVILGMCAAVFFGGVPVKTLAEAVTMPDNLYKVPDALLSVCEVIHTDSQKEQPGVVLPAELHLPARQYDPTLILSVDRDYILYYQGNRSVWVNAESKDYLRQKDIMDVTISGDTSQLPMFQEAIEYLGTDYVVFVEALGIQETMTSAGYENLGVYDGYSIFRVSNG